MFTALKRITCRKAGFSLLELLTVLVILGIFAALAAPSTSRLLNSINFRQQIRELTSILRYARLMSISKGGKVHVEVDESDGTSFHLTGAVEESRSYYLDDEDSLIIEPAEIIFYPESHATPATLTITIGNRTQQITLDPLTALPFANYIEP